MRSLRMKHIESIQTKISILTRLKKLSSPFKNWTQLDQRTFRSHVILRNRIGGLMETPLNSRLDMQNVDPEVKSFIYQVISEFEPYCTPNTQVSVISKDPLKLISHFEANGDEYDRTDLRKMHRISITLAEEGTQLEEEGLDENIFEAIRIAKDKLLKVLMEIQDNVISNQDRAMQINIARESGSVH